MFVWSSSGSSPNLSYGARRATWYATIDLWVHSSWNQQVGRIKPDCFAHRKTVVFVVLPHCYANAAVLYYKIVHSNLRGLNSSQSATLVYKSLLRYSSNSCILHVLPLREMDHFGLLKQHKLHLGIFLGPFISAIFKWHLKFKNVFFF